MIMDGAPSSSSSSSSQRSSPISIHRQTSSDTTISSNDDDRNLFTATVISRIENIMESVVDALLENRVLSIPMRNRKSGNERILRFPSTNLGEVRSFSASLHLWYWMVVIISVLIIYRWFPEVCVFAILYMSHEALISGSIITKRFILSTLNFSVHHCQNHCSAWSTFYSTH